MSCALFVRDKRTNESETSLLAGGVRGVKETAKGGIKVAPADTYAVTQWMYGYFYFEDAPLIKILQELGRWYNLGIVIKDSRYINYKIHFSAYRNDNIQLTLDNINRLQKAKITINDNNIVVE